MISIRNLHTFDQFADCKCILNNYMVLFLVTVMTIVITNQATARQKWSIVVRHRIRTVFSEFHHIFGNFRINLIGEVFCFGLNSQKKMQLIKVDNRKMVVTHMYNIHNSHTYAYIHECRTHSAPFISFFDHLNLNFFSVLIFFRFVFFFFSIYILLRRPKNGSHN